MTNFHRQIVFSAVIAILFAMIVLPAQGAVYLGKGTGTGANIYLIGGDVTSPDDSLKALAYNGSTNESPESFQAKFLREDGTYPWTWVSISSGNKAAFGYESPIALFVNQLGASTGYGTANSLSYKWYDNVVPTTENPAYVTLEFPGAFTLTHFTLTSGTDRMYERHPTEWVIYGSNNGTTWTEICTSPTTSPWDTVGDTTDANTTYLFTSFTGQTLADSGLNAAQQATVAGKLATQTDADFTAKGAFSQYKLEITGLSGNNTTQLGELELFGYTETPYSHVKTKGGSSMFPTPAFHMDASDTASITLEDGRVAKWADTSGGTLSFAQPDAAKRPGVGTNATTGMSFIDFDTTANNLGLVLDASATVGTAFIVNQVDTYVGLGGILGRGPDTGIRMVGNNTGLTNAYWQNSNANDFANGSSGYYHYNGQAGNTTGLGSLHLLTAVAGTNTLSGNDITLGKYFTTNTEARNYIGDVYEIIAFSQKLDALEVKAVEAYLGAKYGLDIAGNPTGGFDKQQFFVGNTTNWDVNNSGEGGFGIATAPNLAFDLWGTATPSLSEGTMLMVTASTDEAFSLKSDTVSVLGEDVDYDIWDKEWYIDVTAPDTADDALYLAFNAADALYGGTVDDTWELLFSDGVSGYTVLSNLGSLTDGTLLFSLGLGALESGYYTIGAQANNAVPEPSTWLMLLVGVLAVGIVRRRQS